jgi:hypothetical protein
MSFWESMGGELVLSAHTRELGSSERNGCSTTFESRIPKLANLRKCLAIANAHIYLSIEKR